MLMKPALAARRGSTSCRPSLQRIATRESRCMDRLRALAATRCPLTAQQGKRHAVAAYGRVASPLQCAENTGPGCVARLPSWLSRAWVPAVLSAARSFLVEIAMRRLFPALLLLVVAFPTSLRAQAPAEHSALLATGHRHPAHPPRPARRSAKKTVDAEATLQLRSLRPIASISLDAVGFESARSASRTATRTALPCTSARMARS